MTAFDFGKAEAESEAPFCPESVFVSNAQMADYAAGFLSVKQDNLAALAFIGQLDEHLEELRAADLAVDAAQYTPRAGYDF
jgi:hypothetical protein